MEKEEKQNGFEPHVKVFNEEVKEDGFHFHHHHHDHDHHHRGHWGGWFWGLVILFFGVVLLLTDLGTLPREIWHYIWQFFWPVLLILVGLRIILRRLY